GGGSQLDLIPHLIRARAASQTVRVRASLTLIEQKGANARAVFARRFARRDGVGRPVSGRVGDHKGGASRRPLKGGHGQGGRGVEDSGGVARGGIACHGLASASKPKGRGPPWLRIRP